MHKELWKMGRYLCDHFSQVLCDFLRATLRHFFAASFTKTQVLISLIFFFAKLFLFLRLENKQIH